MYGSREVDFSRFNTLLLYGHNGPALGLEPDPGVLNFTTLEKGFMDIIIMHIIFPPHFWK